MSKLKLAIALCSILLAGNSAIAFDPGNLSITDGYGEEITYKKGLFGTKRVRVKDRIGNKYENKKGLFGSGSKEVSIFGNKYKSSSGILGSKKQGKTFLGDAVTVKKGILGRRTTEIDLSGLAGVAGAVTDHFMQQPFPDAPPDISSEALVDAYKREKPSSMATQEEYLKTPGQKLLELQSGQ